MKTKMYGGSDDLVEIEGAISDEHADYSQAKIGIRFSASDGTEGIIRYSGEWKIELANKGKKFLGLINSVGEDAEHIFPDAVGCTSYSDVLVLDKGIEWVKIGRKTYKN